MDHPMLETNVVPMEVAFKKQLMVDFTHINMGRMPIRAKRTLIELTLQSRWSDNQWGYIVRNYIVDGEYIDISNFQVVMRRVVNDINKLVDSNVMPYTPIGVYGWGHMVGYLWVDVHVG